MGLQRLLGGLWELRVWGLGVLGFGFRTLEFWIEGLGLRVVGVRLGVFGVQGLGLWAFSAFRV